MSVRTVTRVLRQDGRVAAATRERVNTAAQQLAYRPSVIARSLRTRRTNIIGLITHDLFPDVLARKVLAVEAQAVRNAHRLLLGVSNRDVQQEHQYLADFLQLCDGIVLFLNWGVGLHPESRRILLNSGKPHVLVDTERDVENGISIDRGAAVRQALLQFHGHYQHLAYLGYGFPARLDERLRAFSHTSRELGRDAMTHVMVAAGDDHYYAGAQAAAAIAALRPCLVQCSNDRTAAGLLGRLVDDGIRVPDEVGVVGFDDDDFSRYARVPLSTVRQPVDEIGRAVVDLLEAQLKDTLAPRHVTLSASLIARSSTPPR